LLNFRLIISIVLSVLLVGCSTSTNISNSPTPNSLDLASTMLVQTQAAINTIIANASIQPTIAPSETEAPTLSPVATNTTFLSILPANNPTQTLSPILITQTPSLSLEPLATRTAGSDSQIKIITVNKEAEYVDIKNNGTTPQDLSGWYLVSEVGNQSCLLSGVIQPSAVLRIFAQTSAGLGFDCGFGSNIWNNSKSDPAVLYSSNGQVISRYP